MIVKAVNVINAGAGTTNARCPSCRQLGTFQALGQDLAFQTQSGQICVGHRRCPNPECVAHIFVVFQAGKLLDSYPPLRIDFDATNVPATVVAAL